MQFFTRACSKNILRKRIFLDVIWSWCEINYKQTENVLDEFIWNNSKILYDSKPFFIKRWFEAGITKITDIYNYESRHFYTFEELQNIHNIENQDFLLYHRIIRCIPHEWKEELRKEEVSLETNILLINKVKSMKRVSQLLYNEQISHQAYIIKSHRKWEELFREELNWNQIHKMPFICTIDTRLRYFQYKFIMRIIATNKFLYRCRKSDSNLCSFCNRNI